MPDITKNETSNGLIPLEEVEKKIVVVRGQQVLLDRDVAALYGVETKRVNEAVKNNPRKFHEGYMFELTKEESAALRSKISTIEEPLSSTSLTLEGGKDAIASIISRHSLSEGSTCWLLFSSRNALKMRRLPSLKPSIKYAASSANWWSFTKKPTRKSRRPRCSILERFSLTS